MLNTEGEFDARAHGHEYGVQSHRSAYPVIMLTLFTRNTQPHLQRNSNLMTPRSGGGCEVTIS
jgi:hypothetical protein